MPFSPFTLAAGVFGILGAILVITGLVALFHWRPLRFLVRTLLGLLLLSLGALSGSVALGIHGYRALTHEEVAARISVRRAGPQKFAATVRYPDGPEPVVDLARHEL